MSDIEWTPVKVKLGELSHWAENPVTLTKAQANKLLKSTEKLGRMQTLAIGPANGDGKHPLYDGHQRVNVWGSAFGMDLEVNALQSSRLLTDDERHAVPVMLRTATGSFDWDALASWPVENLAQWGMDDDLLRGWRCDIAALGNMLESEQPEPQDAEPQVDRESELLEKWGVRNGDLWRLGEHYLLCGDSTKREDVKRVMCGEKIELVWTDPPYGVAIGDKNKYLNSIDWSNRIEENLDNDTLDESGLIEMLCASFDNTIAFCIAGAGWYVAAPAGPPHVLFGQVLKDRGIWRQTIQWVKDNSTFSPMGVCYHWQAEPIFFGWLPNGAHRFYGGRKQTTVWNIDRPLKSPEHPTMKPIELVARSVENSSREGEVVADFFVGSGTTLIACQNLSRRCRAIEIAPQYVAVCLERMATAFPDIAIERIENA